MTNPGPSPWTKATVVREDGTRGRVVDQAGGSSARLALQFDDGARVIVEPTSLRPQQDGTYLLPNTARLESDTDQGALATEEQVIPVVAEELEIETRRVARGTVHIHKRVETHEEVVNVPAVNEDVVVEHVPVNTLVEGTPPEVHEEGDVLVIPVLEEVVAVEKRLMLREVLRVSKRRTSSSTPQVVTLRREVVDVERVDADGTARLAGTDPAPSGGRARDR